MAIPKTLSAYLEGQGISYEVIQHPHSSTSWQSVIAAHVDPDRFAKGVLLVDDEGYFLAVLPASQALDMKLLEREFGRRPQMVPENELGRVFKDCAVGAVPALGVAYNLDTVLDSSLKGLSEVCFEAGDHEEIIRLAGTDFDCLVADAWTGSISKPVAQ